MEENNEKMEAMKAIANMEKDEQLKFIFQEVLEGITEFEVQKADEKGFLIYEQDELITIVKRRFETKNIPATDELIKTVIEECERLGLK